MNQPTAQDHEQQLIDYLIEVGEAVEYGEPWTEKTTHEWWIDSSGVRQCRLVQTYHGGGGRGDDDQAEYVRRLIDLGRAAHFARQENGDLVEIEQLTKEDVLYLCQVHPEPKVTHAIVGTGDQVRALRFRRYMPPPEGL